MKNIKTYEGFLDLFSRKPEPEPDISILEYEDQIDSFVDDLKDISIGSHKTKRKTDILYCFCIRDYNSKKEEINLFLEEIESITKSINIKFKYLLKEDTIDLSYVSVLSKSGKEIDFIVLSFFTQKDSKNYFILKTVEECADKLGFKYDCFDWDDVEDIDYEYRETGEEEQEPEEE